MTCIHKFDNEKVLCLTGIGIGFVTGLLPVIISDYFGKRSAAACGLSYAGAGVGAFFFPIVFQCLLDSFGLRGSLLIMGALAFHAIGGALLLSPPPVYEQKRAESGDDQETGAGGRREAHDRETRHRSVPRVTKSGENVAVGNPEGSAGVENDLSGEAVSDPAAGYGLDDDISDTACGQGSRMCCTSRRDERREPSLPALDSRDERALLNESRSPEDVSDNGASQQKRDEQTVVDCEGTQQQPHPSFPKQMFSRMAQDARLLREPHFFLITLTYVSYILGNVTLLMILPDYVVDVGQPRSTALLLLSLFSVTDLLGRLLPMWMSCFPFSPSNKSLYASSIGSMGILFFLYPILLSDISPDNACIVLIFLTLSCGFVSGCQMILPPVLAAEMLGQENTAMAFGLSNFICGFFSFSRPFIFREYGMTSATAPNLFLSCNSDQYSSPCSLPLQDVSCITANTTESSTSSDHLL